MANYQIKLTPVDTFFFGGEKHDENLEMNYFVESLPYPQQTTLLGFLRYLLLVKNTGVFDRRIITDQNAASGLIGESSFDFNEPPVNYGKIIALSPLYLSYKNEAYFIAPFDYGFDLNGGLQLSFGGINYNAKAHYSLISELKLINNKGEVAKLSSIVSDAEQVGNEKAESGEPRDKKFYKQFSKRLHDGWSFCVDAELQEGAGVADGDVLFLPFGGEKSYFKVEVKQQEKKSFALSEKFKRNTPYIFCASDCFVDGSVVKEADFAVTNYVSFRNLQSKVNVTTKYSVLSATDERELKRSSRFNLLQRGSILYFKSKEKLDEALSKFQQPHCQTIGFNHIITT